MRRSTGLRPGCGCPRREELIGWTARVPTGFGTSFRKRFPSHRTRRSGGARCPTHPDGRHRPHDTRRVDRGRPGVGRAGRRRVSRGAGARLVAMVTRGAGHAEHVRELPLDEALVSCGGRIAAGGASCRRRARCGRSCASRLLAPSHAAERLRAAGGCGRSPTVAHVCVARLRGRGRSRCWCSLRSRRPSRSRARARVADPGAVRAPRRDRHARSLAPGADASRARLARPVGDLVRPRRARPARAPPGSSPSPAGSAVARGRGRRAAPSAGAASPCWCVRRATDPEGARLPSGDRVRASAAPRLRSDEEGFATVANLAFSDARWRVRRRLPKRQRAALDAVGRSATLLA